MDVVGSGTDYSKEAKFTETVAKKICRHDRQPSRPQGCRRPRGDRSARRNTSLSAQIPIEMSFSKLKADLRKAAERTIPRLRRRIASISRIGNRNASGVSLPLSTPRI
jgi:hypothetical protein